MYVVFRISALAFQTYFELRENRFYCVLIASSVGYYKN